jgi:hypothetical protein
VLRAADGASTTASAAAPGVARHTVQHWRDRFDHQLKDKVASSVFAVAACYGHV